MDIKLGVLEELVLLLLLTRDETYGVEIAKEYEKQLNQSISIPAIHVVLKRLEQKGLVTSYMGEASAIRGGRSKRLYKATLDGYNTARSLQKSREAIWNLIPKMNFSGI